MANPMIFDMVKQAVSAVEAGEMLGLNPSFGRCSCPVHNGRDRNMRLYKGDRGFYCFVCGAHGDVIDLTQEVLGCDRKHALNWLNSAFNLGLDIDNPMDEKALWDAKNAQRRRREEREANRMMLRAFERMAEDASWDLCALEMAMESHRPARPEEDWDPEFEAALMGLAEARYREGVQRAVYGIVKERVCG